MRLGGQRSPVVRHHMVPRLHRVVHDSIHHLVPKFAIRRVVCATVGAVGVIEGDLIGKSLSPSNPLINNSIGGPLGDSGLGYPVAGNSDFAFTYNGVDYSGFPSVSGLNYLLRGPVAADFILPLQDTDVTISTITMPPFSDQVIPIAPVSEPSIIVLMISALALLLFLRRRSYFGNKETRRALGSWN
jgi:hypothetical protein